MARKWIREKKRMVTGHGERSSGEVTRKWNRESERNVIKQGERSDRERSGGGVARLEKAHKW